MAKKTKDERDEEILEYRVAKAEELILNYEKYSISEDKIDKIKAKKDKHSEKLKKNKDKKK